MIDYGELAKNLISDYFPMFGSFGIDCEYFRRVRTVKTSMLGAGDVGTCDDFDNGVPLYLIFANLDETLIDDDVVVSSDKKVIFPSKSVNFRPIIYDKIVKPDGSEWFVVSVREDPKPAVYVLVVRPRLGGVS